MEFLPLSRMLKFPFVHPVTVIAVIVKPCIVNVLGIIFELAI